ncbi:MAG TPA: CARDB domain-containing protein [Phycisphaerae bacterium]|nr:CARDB domain-containing protein [Phycisphaerae bacterium]HQE27814.1 CARDB domain-containing protein [Phycisphaerae bacterium]
MKLTSLVLAMLVHAADLTAGTAAADEVGQPAPAVTTDLNVTYIERLPRYDYDAAKNQPAAGDVVTFVGHVRLWGSTPLASVAYRWELDGQPVDSGTLTNLQPGTEQTVTWNWTWQSGNHTIKLIVDPDSQVAELSELNNQIEDRTNAIIAGFWVEQSVYDYFAANQHKLGVGSNSWEDWIQRQMRYWNQFCAQAIYPTTPQGVLDRVRIDKIVVVPDGALPLHGGLPTNNPDLWDKTVDLMWGFPATLLDGSMYANVTSASMSNPFFFEGSLLHELGHARYLVDTYGFDVHNTSSHASVQIYEGDKPVAGSSYMPFVAFGEVLYYNKYGKLMSGGHDQGWSEYDAGALNRIAGQRATCGNYNAPCNIGAYINDLPQRNHLRLLDSNGAARRRANVKIFQAAGGPGWYGKTFDNTPDLEFTSDLDGYVHLPRNPFSSGPIRHTYGEANGTMILRIEHQGQVWYRFLEVTDFNIQYWRGNTEDAYYSFALPGTNRPAADFTYDGRVNEDDLPHFLACLAGADEPIADPDCADADLDEDGDVDQSDFGLMQRCYSGTAQADPGC